MSKNIIVKVLTVEEWCEEHRYGVVARFKRADKYCCPVCSVESIKFLVKLETLVCPSCEVVHFSEDGKVLTSQEMIPALRTHWGRSSSWIEFIHDISMGAKTKPSLA